MKKDQIISFVLPVGWIMFLLGSVIADIGEEMCSEKYVFNPGDAFWVAGTLIVIFVMGALAGSAWEDLKNDK